MHVALRGRDPRVPEELLHEARIGVPGDQAAGGVTQGMEAQRAQPGGVARAALKRRRTAEGSRRRPRRGQNT